MATSQGPLKTSVPLPATPALPSDINSFPSGLNFRTWLPLPSLIWASVTQTFPSRSIVMPCACTIIPSPKLLTTLPVGSNRITGGSERWKTHISPFAAGSTEMTPAHFAPAGSLAQFVSSRYGFGALPLWAAMVTTASRSNAAPTRTGFTRRDCGMWSSKEFLRCWRRCAGLEKDFHPLEPSAEILRSLRPLRFARGVVGQHRVVVDEVIDDLRGGRSDRPRFEGAVIEVIRLTILHRLGVG